MITQKEVRRKIYCHNIAFFAEETEGINVATAGVEWSLFTSDSLQQQQDTAPGFTKNRTTV